MISDQVSSHSNEKKKLIESRWVGQSCLDLFLISANIFKRSYSYGMVIEWLPQIHEALGSISRAEKIKTIYNNQEGFYIVFKVTDP